MKSCSRCTCSITYARTVRLYARTDTDQEEAKEEEGEKEEYPEAIGTAQWHHGQQYRMVAVGLMSRWERGCVQTP